MIPVVELGLKSSTKSMFPKIVLYLCLLLLVLQDFSH